METFRDRAVKKELYEYQEGDSVGQMLEWSDTNSNVNQEMSRVILLLSQAQSKWKGGYAHIFDKTIELVQKLNLQMGGLARIQAIEMAGAHTVGEQMLEKKKEKKGGILGALGL